MMTESFSLQHKFSTGGIVAACPSARHLAQACLAVLAMCFWAASAQADVASVVLHSFDNGVLPVAAPIIDEDGNLYGTTEFGGAAGNGTVFRLSASGTFEVLHEFLGFDYSSVNTGGAYPQSRLVLGADGALYGTTYKGGSHGIGTVFKLTTNGDFATLYEFGAPGESGGYPSAGLVIGPDGNFYGTTSGAGSGGSAFRITPTGVLTTLHEFCVGCSDGSSPEGEVVFDEEGNLYGTTQYEGIGYGTAYKIAKDGTFTKIYDFDFDNGSQPVGPLVLGADGNFYGVTFKGGAHSNGAVFKMSPAGAVTVLHSFSALGNGGVNSDGMEPSAGLLLAGDGNFYGTTKDAGAKSAGTVFRVAPDGGFSILYAFANSPDAAFSEGELIEGTDGTLYGTTMGGGDYHGGTVFKLTNVLGGPLPAPTALAATPGNGEVTLSWTASSGAASYNVYLGTSAGGEVMAPVQTGLTTAHTVINSLTNGTAYFFTVAAVSGASTSVYSNEASATPLAGPAATPSFTPAAGTYDTAQSVTITVETDGAQIYYTTDGSTPTTHSTRYTGPIDVAVSETLRALAVAAAYADSAVAAASYTITPKSTGSDTSTGTGDSTGGDASTGTGGSTGGETPSQSSGGGGGAAGPGLLALLLVFAAWQRRPGLHRRLPSARLRETM